MNSPALWTGIKTENVGAEGTAGTRRFCMEDRGKHITNNGSVVGAVYDRPRRRSTGWPAVIDVIDRPYSERIRGSARNVHTHFICKGVRSYPDAGCCFLVRKL